MATKTKKKIETKKLTKKAVVEKVDLSKFAIVDVNGQQLKVHEGYAYTLEKLDGEKGDRIESNKVLLISDGKDLKVGKPYVEKAKVIMEIESQKKDKKMRIFKYKAKSRYRRTYGHRQLITRIRVKEILG